MLSNIQHGLVTQTYRLTLVGEHSGGISAEIEIKKERRGERERESGTAKASVTLLIFKVTVHTRCCERGRGG